MVRPQSHVFAIFARKDLLRTLPRARRASRAGKSHYLFFSLRIAQSDPPHAGSRAPFLGVDVILVHVLGLALIPSHLSRKFPVRVALMRPQAAPFQTSELVWDAERQPNARERGLEVCFGVEFHQRSSGVHGCMHRDGAVATDTVGNLDEGAARVVLGSRGVNGYVFTPLREPVGAAHLANPCRRGVCDLRG